MLASSAAPVIALLITPPFDRDSKLGIALVVVFVVGLTWLASAAFAAYLLRRTHARVLAIDEAPAVFRIVREESIRIGLSPKLAPRVYVTDWDTRVTARVLNGFTPKLVISGAFTILADRERDDAQIILRHELAHILAGDTKLFVYVMLLLGGLIALPFSGVWLPSAIAISIFQATFLVHLLRRREYLADAFSVNWTPSGPAYIDALLGAKNEDGRKHQPEEHSASSFHPNRQARVRAIEDDCPVLRTSIGILAFYTFVICVSAWQIYISEGPTQIVIATISALVSSALPLIGMVVEVSKGFGRKRPLPLPDFLADMQASSEQEPTTSTSVLSPVLAQVSGLATDRVEWSAILLFFASYSLTDVAIAAVFGHGGSLWMELFLVSVWTISVLGSFRYVRNIILAAFAGSVMCAAAVAVLRLGMVVLTRASLQPFLTTFSGSSRWAFQSN
jgi:Zn-dependent protease with chaperone function